MNLYGRQQDEFGNEGEAHRLKLYRAAYGSSRSKASTSWVPRRGGLKVNRPGRETDRKLEPVAWGERAR